MKNYLIPPCFDSFASIVELCCNHPTLYLQSSVFSVAELKKELRFLCHLDIKTVCHITDLQEMLGAALV